MPSIEQYLARLRGKPEPSHAYPSKAERDAWEQQCRSGAEAYDYLYEALKDEPADLSVLPADLKQRIFALFIENGFYIRLGAGGPRGVNADVYFMFRSGSVPSLFQEKDYGTERYIRMKKAAYAYADLLMHRRDVIIDKLRIELEREFAKG